MSVLKRWSRRESAQATVYQKHRFVLNRKISINLDGWSIKAVDLAERFIANIKMIVKEKHTVIDMHPFSQDALLILKKENEEVCEDV